MKDRDRNSIYFHVVVSHRRRINEISKLRDALGALHSQQADMERTTFEYFQSMFTSVSTSSFQQVICHIREVVTSEMNNTLLEDFSQEEVKEALFQMHPTKTPGPDGMNQSFFQKYWNIIGTDISNAMIDYLSS